MSIAENKAAARRIVEEVINGGSLDRVNELVAPSYADRAGGADGPEGYRRSVAAFREAFPDLRLEIRDLIAEGDTVAVRYRATGTHRGSFLKIAPTGRRVAYDGVGILRFEAGRMVERWNCSDLLCVLDQLGALPPELR